MAVDNAKIAEGVLAAIGGADNIVSATHCMTRLRLTPKDKTKIDDDAVKAVKGVLGINWAGAQLQVIIGQSVPKVYEAILSRGVTGSGSVDENLDEGLVGPKEKLTLGGIGSAILDYLSGTMVQMIPIMMAAGLFRTIGVVVGPSMLNICGAEDPPYIVFNTTLYEAGFYFLPIYLGYCAAKKIGASPVLGLLSGGILVAPSLVSAAAKGGSGIVSVYGFQIAAANYSQSVLPILLTIPVLYVIEKWMKKHVPDVLSTIFTPFLTMVVIVPIELILLAPIGGIIGNGIGIVIGALSAAGGIGGILVRAILGAFWQLFVVAGMHMPVIMLAQVQLMQQGSDPLIFVSTNAAMFAIWGVAIGAFLRIRNKEEKALTAGYIIAGVLGGVTEPALFGVLLRWRRTMLGMFVGGAVGSVVSGLLGSVVYPGATATNLLIFLGYLPGGTQSFFGAIVGCVVSVVVAAIVTFMFGFSREDMDAMAEEA